jgi:uncharacterized membrane protein
MTPDEIRATIERVNAAVEQETAEQIEAASKPWWQSRAIWGAVIVVLAQLARLIDVDIDVDGLTDAALSLATLIGAVMAWWGRMRADQAISQTRILPGVTLL